MNSPYESNLDIDIENSLLKHVQAAKASHEDDPDSVIYQVYDQIEAAILIEQVRRRLASVGPYDGNYVNCVGSVGFVGYANPVNYANMGASPIAEFKNTVPDMRLFEPEDRAGFPWLTVGLAVVATLTLVAAWVSL